MDIEVLGYGYVAWGILVYMVTFLGGALVIGVGVARVGQCLWNKVTGKASFGGCLFSTDIDPTET